MNKNLQQEKDFLLLIESHKRVIYKVCYMYATDDELLNDLYQEIVMNLWRAIPVSWRKLSSHVDIPYQPEHMHFVPAEIKTSDSGCNLTGQFQSFCRRRRKQIVAIA